MEELFVVGTIVGTHGLKGEVKVVSRTDFPELRFAAGSTLLLAPKNGRGLVTVVVKSARIHKAQYLVAFDGYDAIEQVEALRSSELKVYRSQTPKLPEGEYWIDDLLGCQVKSDEGKELGVIVDVLTPGANDVYVVRGESGKDILVPAIINCILSVDVASKSMVVHLLPGLVEENQ